MLSFDETAFLQKSRSTVALRPQIEALVDRLTTKGIRNVLLVGAGGTFAAVWPYEHLAHRFSTLPVRSAIAAELITSGDASLGEGTVAVFTSVSGTTDDALRAVEYCKAHGALTIGFTGYAESPLASMVDEALISEPEAWPFDVQLLLFTTRLLSNRGEFSGYEKFADELAAIPEIMVQVARQADAPASDFALKHKDTNYHFLSGTGNLWGFTYLYSMCILEEMQWLHTTRVHGAEFFHGSLELIQEDTSLLLFRGEDETRPLMDRVVDFANKYSHNVTVVDTADYPLEGISPEFRGLLSPLVADTAASRISKHLEKQRDHSLDLRRYYRVVEY
ncbi:SIS domain-containing protein [Arthrobacter cryoconiti]|uniref:SIS domain-containing protein n=1 Tax=Arthrobacter cryoconiti TaxID=748907 RepID=A0ABV8QWC3_9MICC|nr:SIS domain-containing protein [Arthrobacter cryoconiti]MCC9069708.1 SIS domain-containing protein [Arthrobacter cryoconiti]